MPSAVGTWFFPGVLARLLHPNSVIFAAVVLIVIFPQDLRTREKAFIGSNHLVLGWVLYGALTWLVSRPAVTARHLKAQSWIDKCAASVLSVLGLRLLLCMRQGKTEKMPSFLLSLTEQAGENIKLQQPSFSSLEQMHNKTRTKREIFWTRWRWWRLGRVLPL